MFKKTITLSILFVFVVSVNMFSQMKTNPEDRRTAANIGVLMGGGSIVGVDAEFLLTKQLGILMGAGLATFEGGLSFHPKSRINSSFLSLQYMHQGLGDNHYASYITPMYNFRTRKIFQAGIGLGYIVSKGQRFYDAFPGDRGKDMAMLLTYNIGIYFPF